MHPDTTRLVAAERLADLHRAAAARPGRRRRRTPTVRRLAQVVSPAEADVRPPYGTGAGARSGT